MTDPPKDSVYSSIIALNTLNDPSALGFDVQRSRETPLNANTFESVGYNLIGTGNALLNFSVDGTNQVEVTAQQLLLGPLADNGGKTLTHLPQPGSIAIDSGDPMAILPADATGEEDEDVTVVTEYDQRGMPFSRITAGQIDGTPRLDIGAIEVPTPEPTGDFDEDGDTDGVDFLAWQRGFGKTDAQRADGDSNADGIVDGVDLQNWQDRYGEDAGPEEIASHASQGYQEMAEPQASLAAESLVASRGSDSGSLSFILAAQSTSTRGLGLAGDDLEDHQQADTQFQVQEANATNPAVERTVRARHLAGQTEQQAAEQTHIETVESLDRAFAGLDLERFFG